MAVETLFKTFLTLPSSTINFHTKRNNRNEASKGNFHELLRGVQDANPQKAKLFNFAYIEHYHNLRNVLYHQGNQVMAVPMEQLEGYAELAVGLLQEYLDVDLSNLLTTRYPAIEEKTSVVDSVEISMLTGKLRIARLKSKTVTITDIDTNQEVKPVKPILREIIREKKLPVSLLLKSGNNKNTQILGKDVIDALHSQKNQIKITREANYVALKDIDNATKTKPSSLVLPNRVEVHVATWTEVLIHCVRYALDCNEQIPIPYKDAAGKKVDLLSQTRPQLGITYFEFDYSDLTIFVYTNYDSNNCIRNSIHILEEVPSKFISVPPSVVYG